MMLVSHGQPAVNSDVSVKGAGYTNKEPLELELAIQVQHW